MSILGNAPDRRESAFNEASGAKIQLTWDSVYITAPPKKSMWKKAPVDAEDKIILSKRVFQF